MSTGGSGPEKKKVTKNERIRKKKKGKAPGALTPAPAAMRNGDGLHGKTSPTIVTRKSRSTGKSGSRSTFS